MLGSIGKQKFTKALILSGGASVVEVDVAHAPRHGPSRYSPLRLTRLALHVLAGFWPQPIQWIGVLLGTVSSLLALALGIYGVVFWIDESNFPGPLFGGVAVLFVLGIQGFILALVGEYLGRIQRDVEGRPIYTIDRELLYCCSGAAARIASFSSSCNAPFVSKATAPASRACSASAGSSRPVTRITRVVRAADAQAPRGLEAVDLRHAHVDHGDLGLFRDGELDGGAAVARGPDHRRAGRRGRAAAPTHRRTGGDRRRSRPGQEWIESLWA